MVRLYVYSAYTVCSAQPGRLGYSPPVVWWRGFLRSAEFVVAASPTRKNGGGLAGVL